MNGATTNVLSFLKPYTYNMYINKETKCGKFLKGNNSYNTVYCTAQILAVLSVVGQICQRDVVVELSGTVLLWNFQVLYIEELSGTVNCS